MKRPAMLFWGIPLLILCLGLGFAGDVRSQSEPVVSLYVDSAPNVYGSPSWPGWWSATKSEVANGGIINLRTGKYPRSNIIDPVDEIIYSTGDLGKRLHWIYWLPGQTVAGLQGLFEVKWVIDWDGVAWTLDASNNWVLDSPDEGWFQPASWEDYSGGVIGSLGFAWWAVDDDADPLSTDGDPYNEVDAADIAALRKTVFAYQTYAKGLVRYRPTAQSPWEVSELKVLLVDFESMGVSTGVIYDKAAPLKDTYEFYDLTQCTGLAEALEGLGEKSVYVKVGPYTINVPGSELTYYKTGYWIYYQPSKTADDPFIKLYFFPDTQKIRMYVSKVVLDGIAIPIEVTVAIGDRGWQLPENADWKTVVTTGITKYILSKFTPAVPTKSFMQAMSLNPQKPFVHLVK